MTRAIPQKLTALAMNFVAQYPIDQRQPIQLTSDDLDTFGLGQGVYGVVTASSSSAELNEARGSLVSRLNKAGSAKSWTDANDGFQIDVVDRGAAGVPTTWAVKALYISASHQAARMPDRNVTTITNRVLKHERIFEHVDRSQLTKDEERAIDEERDIVVRLAQHAADVARIENAIMNKTLNRLAKKDPNNRLLPK